ncbi:MAG: hypothetical protein RLZZ84_434 [Pseudomonadota bacterium]|jgi:hypothetical protein
MLTSIGKHAAAALALAALPGVAHAGTATATGSASFGVGSQCSVTGASVNLGSFLTTDTWGTVGAALGQFSSTFTAGSRGTEYLNFGSVTCDTGVPYTLGISGTAASPTFPSGTGGINLTVNGKTMILVHSVKKLGANTIGDSNFALPGIGRQLISGVTVSGTGTGAAQAVLGNAFLGASFSGTSALLTDALTITGAYTDTLTYTLTF